MTTSIGLLGAAGIAGAAVLLPVRRRDDVVVAVVASLSAARTYAAEHGIERAYDSYSASSGMASSGMASSGQVNASVEASMVEGVPLRSSLTLTGARGSLLVDNIVFPSAGHTIRLEVDGVLRVSTVAGRTTYDHQLEAVLDALRTGSPLPTEGEDPIANMAAIDAIYAAAGFDR